MPDTATMEQVEPYKLSEIFSIIPEFDGNPITLQTFLNSCVYAQSMAINDQKLLLTLHIKNKLRGKAAELINSRNPATWAEIKSLLDAHFGDSRDLTSLIQDLQRIHQMQNESALTFVSRLQTHNAKMHASIQKQNLTIEQKKAQSDLIETMTLNTLLTGLEPKLGQIIRAGNPPNMLQATNRIRRELQLSYFESQKFPKNNPVRNSVPPQQKRPNTNLNFQKSCSFCKRNGHTISECRTRQQQQSMPSNSQNFQRPNFQGNSNFQNFSQQNNQSSYRTSPQNNQSNNPQQNRPSAIRPNPNFNQQRPSAIQPNPNYNRFNQQKAHHLNYEPCNSQYDSNQYDSNQYDSNQFNQYQNYSSDYQVQNETYDYGNNSENYTANSQSENYEDYGANPQDFYQGFDQLTDPPNQDNEPIAELQTQIQTMNLNDNLNPFLNFPEQNFM